MCDNCSWTPESVNSEKLFVCNTCYSQEPHILMVEDDVRKKYPFGDELNILRCIKVDGVITDSPFYCLTPKLYLVKDIEYIGKLNYGDDAWKKAVEERINSTLFSKTNMFKLQIKKKYEEEDRKKMLDNYLKTSGLQGIKSDSKLCQLFIEKGYASGFTPEFIRDKLKEMDFFYQYTNYRNILFKLRNEYIEMKKKEYSVDFYHWTDEDEEPIRQQAKDTALLEYQNMNKDNEDKLSLIPSSLLHKEGNDLEIDDYNHINITI